MTSPGSQTSRTGMPEVEPFRVSLPASSANLGPAFDTAGLAMSLWLHITARLSPEWRLEASGRNAELTGQQKDNLILTTYRDTLGSLGLAVPALSLQIENEIPLGMGCGSSAAAICAGILLANHFGQLGWTEQQVLDAAVRCEGHPDNVAACLLGGMTVSRTLLDKDGGSAQTVSASFGAALRWRLLLALPFGAVSTKKARALLPATYSRGDTVSNLQSTALLLSAFALDRPDLLRAAADDCLHQPYRILLCPLLARLLPLQRESGVFSVTLSGAGPSVLLVVEDDFSVDRIYEAAGAEVAEVLDLRIAAAPDRSPQSAAR